MKSRVFPLVNDAAMVRRINSSLATFMAPENIVVNTPAIMASEDFHHLVIHNKKTVYDFIMVGTANGELVAKATQEGKRYPFFNHNGNYQVDLAAIPLGTLIGTTALFELLKK
jgi:hippurate hydrolase